MVQVRLDKEIEIWRSIGECLRAGELILSPFEQPIEEERRGDPDQSDDDLTFQGPNRNLCEPLEEGLVVRRVSDISFPTRFRYFLDGSVRTKYLGEYVEGHVSTPLLVADISVAVIERVKDRLKPAYYKKNLFFIFPHKDSGFLTDTTAERLENISQDLNKEDGLTRVEFLKKAELSGDVRYSLLGKVRRLMHDMEHQAAIDLRRGRNDWLIMDGAIRKQEFLDLQNTIGLAKSFSRKPIITHAGKQVMLSAYMKDVREGTRSAILKKSAPNEEVYKQLIFWYVRLRTFPPMEPLGGIVKVDLKAEGDPSGWTQLADEISAELYSMRSPSVYPWPRWPSYIYPIRIAEMYMSSRYLGDYVLAQVGEELRRRVLS